MSWKECMCFHLCFCNIFERLCFPAEPGRFCPAVSLSSGTEASHRCDLCWLSVASKHHIDSQDRLCHRSEQPIVKVTEASLRTWSVKWVCFQEGRWVGRSQGFWVPSLQGFPTASSRGSGSSLLFHLHGSHETDSADKCPLRLSASLEN